MKKNYLRNVMVALTLLAAVGVQATELLTSNDRVFIEDFSIKPGETQLVDVWMESSIPWTALETHIFLPEGLSWVMPEKDDVNSESFKYERDSYAALSLNFWNKSLISGRDISTWKENGNNFGYASAVIPENERELFTAVWSQNKDFMIFGNGNYCLFQIKVKAEDTFMGGKIEVCPDGGLKFMSYANGGTYVGASSDAEVEYHGQPSYAMVTLPPVGIEDVKAAEAVGEGRMYDLQGRPVTTATPAPGIYVKNGHKVLIK